ncbi:MAG: head GIN domain-containing protein [Eudoraea sp.]|uniref:head GIN domain-containing protein n=1 Tax=Eudoraea sp. TaxID=1979955 RepID=UPI0032663565
MKTKVTYLKSKYLQVVVVVFGLIFLMSCNGDNAPDCFQNAGDTIRDVIPVESFTKITVNENTKLVLKEGSDTLVEVETGEFLRNEVKAEVKDGRLLLTDTNNCNFFREYGLTTFYVTAPNITEIRSNTGFSTVSDGVLAYPQITLISESFNDPENLTTDGEFDLELASQNVNVVVNGIAYFKLRGNSANLSVVVAAGDTRIEAVLLLVQNVTLDHRGSNDILINPQESLRGTIRGTGDVRSYNRPDIVEVQELYRGRLIFDD